jgi:hypothetical protein
VSSAQTGRAEGDRRGEERKKEVTEEDEGRERKRERERATWKTIGDVENNFGSQITEAPRALVNLYVKCAFLSRRHISFFFIQ